MSKEEPGRLLSKMAKFVRNPLKDWSELDTQEPVAGEPDYSREMVKEMIERRQRNDSVRRREFDSLRRLRQRVASGSADHEALSSLSSGTASDRHEERAMTLRKIDEIEAQMSKQWWKGDPRTDDGNSVVHPEVLAAQRVRAYADTTPGIHPDHDLPQVPARASDFDPAAPTTAAPAASAISAASIYDSALDEAAIRFAQGDDIGAEAVLLQTLGDDGALVDHADTWLALLDFYCATGEAGKFEAACARFAQRLRLKPPEWVSLRAIAAEGDPRDPSAESGDDGAVVADWRSPARLQRADLAQLTRALSGAGPSWRLDWRALVTIEPEAAAPLRVLLAHWADSPVDLHFAGGQRLGAVLERATPLGDRGVPEMWWQLRLAALRVMHAVDRFELVALHYCITFEAVPPSWEEPRGQYASLDAQGHPETDAQALAFLQAGDNAALATGGEGGHPRSSLSGELSGDVPEIWRRLDAELADAEFAARPAVVSCAGLVRLDFAAAGALLNWAAAHDARGRRIRFVGVHRLVAAFFRVVGVSDHAVIALR
jgi:ABC-type transporter Mla MlaB component